MKDLLMRPLVMGVINVTPDSFSGDGLLLKRDYVTEAVAQANIMLRDGADILDVGGESTRPGSRLVEVAEEIHRTAPVIKALRDKFSTASIAIDTTKAEVAEAALKAGATIINDISALASDVKMAKIAATHQAYIILMHNRAAFGVHHDEKIGSQYKAPLYGNILEDVRNDLKESAERAFASGISKEKIILDPGIGFGKTPHQNMSLIMHLDHLKNLGFPVLIGASRKSFIGHFLDLPIGERVEGTAACVTASVLKGADILRVHDVKYMARVVKIAALLRDA